MTQNIAGDLSPAEATKFLEGLRGVEINASAVLKGSGSDRHAGPLPTMVKELVDELLVYDEADIARVPYDYLCAPQDAFKKMVGVLTKLRGAGAAPQAEVMTEAWAVWRALSTQLAVPLCILATRSTKVARSFSAIDDLLKNATQTAARINQEASGVTTAITTRAQEAESEARAAADRIKAIEPGATVAAHQKHFRSVASDHDDLAGQWLKATIGVGSLVVVAAIVAAIEWPAPHNDTFNIATNLTGKAIVLSVFYYAAIVCLKNYRAHRHLQVVNAMRANALGTFQAFVRAAGKDTKTKNKVLLAATSAIFSQTATGYALTEQDPSLGQVIEVAKLGK